MDFLAKSDWPQGSPGEGLMTCAAGVAAGGPEFPPACFDKITICRSEDPEPPFAAGLRNTVSRQRANQSSRLSALMASPLSLFQMTISHMTISSLLHAAALAFLLIAPFGGEAVSVGESVMEIEMVMAEAEIDAPLVIETLPQPPDPMSTMPPSPEASQAPEQKAEEGKAEEEPDIRIPTEEPQPVLFRAEDRAVSVANTGPAQAASTARDAAYQKNYPAAVARHLARFKRFPAGLPRQASGGKVVLRFTLSDAGKVVEVLLIEGSGFAVLDTEALAMVRRAEPFPPPVREAEFVIPVSYRVR